MVHDTTPSALAFCKLSCVGTCEVGKLIWITKWSKMDGFKTVGLVYTASSYWNRFLTYRQLNATDPIWDSNQMSRSQLYNQLNKSWEVLRDWLLIPLHQIVWWSLLLQPQSVIVTRQSFQKSSKHHNNSSTGAINISTPFLILSDWLCSCQRTVTYYSGHFYMLGGTTRQKSKLLHKWSLRRNSRERRDSTLGPLTWFITAVHWFVPAGSF